MVGRCSFFIKSFANCESVSNFTPNFALGNMRKAISGYAQALRSATEGGWKRGRTAKLRQKQKNQILSWQHQLLKSLTEN
mgnify:FL=1|jgi:hypothetical protein